MQKSLILVSLLIFLMVSCKKDPKNVTDEHAGHNHDVIYKNDVQLNFTNMVGNVVLKLAKDTDSFYPGIPKYITQLNDTFTIITFRYYISNIKLKRPDGSYFTEPESYHLLDAADSNNTCKFILKDVPLENYIAVELTIGVDSLRNCSGAQTGDLSQDKDMFWDWFQGYIFCKLEGYSFSAPANSTTRNMAFHVGGFIPPYNNIRTVTLPFPTGLTLTDNKVPTVYLKTNILEAFTNPQTLDTLDIGNYYLGTIPSQTQDLVNCYVDMISVSAIKN